MLPSASRIRARAHSAHCERKRVVAPSTGRWPRRRLPGPPDVVAVQADQRQHAAAEQEPEALAGPGGQFDARLDLGHRLVPLPGHEVLHDAGHVVAALMPAEAEFLADPAAGLERGPRVGQAVQLDQDVAAGDVDRIAVPLPVRAEVGRPHRAVDQLRRPAEPPAVQGHDRGHGAGDRGRHVVPGRRGRGSGLFRGGRAPIEVAEPHPRDAGPAQGAGPFGPGEQGR